MKRCYAKFAVAAVLLGAIAASDAHAGGGHRGGHWGGGHFFAPFDPRVLGGAALLAPLLYAPPPKADIPQRVISRQPVCALHEMIDAT